MSTVFLTGRPQMVELSRNYEDGKTLMQNSLVFQLLYHHLHALLLVKVICDCDILFLDFYFIREICFSKTRKFNLCYRLGVICILWLQRPNLGTRRTCWWNYRYLFWTKVYLINIHIIYLFVIWLVVELIETIKQ